MLDLEKLIYELLKKSLPDVTILPDVEVDSINHFPLITFTVVGGSALDLSGPRPNGWEADLSISLFEDDIDKAKALALTVYDVVWSWDDPFNDAGRIEGLGNAASIDDKSIFTRVGSVAIDDLTVTQMAGEYSLHLHEH